MKGMTGSSGSSHFKNMKYNYDTTRAHFLYAYPRSGKDQQELRILLFLYRCLKEKYPDPSWGVISELIGHTGHLGFDDLLSKNRGPELNQFPPPGSHITLILRSACDTLADCFSYLQGYKGYENLIPKDGSFPNTLDEYAAGDFGVKKFVQFLNAVNDEFDVLQYEVDLIFYEDLAGKEILKRIPSILGVEHELVKHDLDFIYRNSLPDSLAKRAQGIISKRDIVESPNLNKFMDGAAISYPFDPISDEARNIVDEYVGRHSRLEAYNERYGYGIAR